MELQRTEQLLDGIDAVLFDLDGTLADSMWIWLDIDREFFASRHMPYPEDLNDAIEGMGFTETAVYFKERFHLSESVEELKALWNAMAEEAYRTKIPLKPGAEEFLFLLREKDIRCGIATSNTLPLVEEFLAARGVRDLFDAIATVCEVPSGKPSPDVYLLAAERLGVKPERCLVFEDVPMGILAGKNAGMRVCGVEDTYAAHLREKKRELADDYIEDFTELLDGIRP